MPMFLLGMSVRTGASIADVAAADIVPAQESLSTPVGNLDQTSSVLEDANLCVAGPDAAEVVEEELREGRDENDGQDCGPWSFAVCPACHSLDALNASEGLGGLPGQPRTDSVLPVTGLYRLFSVFRI